MNKTFIAKNPELTKAEQRTELKGQGHTGISYSGKERGFYVNK